MRVSTDQQLRYIGCESADRNAHFPDIDARNVERSVVSKLQLNPDIEYRGLGAVRNFCLDVMKISWFTDAGDQREECAIILEVSESA